MYTIYGVYVSNRCIFFVLQDGQTALMDAAENGHREVVELLIKHGADVNAIDEVSICSDGHYTLFDEQAFKLTQYMYSVL